MKKTLAFLFLLSALLLPGSVCSHNKVVVIPLNSNKKLHNIITVSPSGGDFTDPAAAINSITDASSDNPYLIFIGPGVYTLTQSLNMTKPYVSIAGAGQHLTTLTGSISSETTDVFSSLIIIGADNSTLSDITVKNAGGNLASIAIYVLFSSPHLREVTAIASGGTSNAIGILNMSSGTKMTNVTISATGGYDTYGIVNDSSINMNNITATASNGSNSNIGVQNYYQAAPITMTNLTATAFGGTDNIGVVHEFSTTPLTLKQCNLNGTSGGLRVGDGSVANIIRSSIVGGVVTEGAGIAKCINSDNGTDNVLDKSCVVIP